MMIQSVRQTLFTGWHFMRWLRLGLGIFFLVQAIQSRDSILGLIAGLLLFQVASNTGCCGVNGCAVPRAKEDINDSNTAPVEEIK